MKTMTCRSLGGPCEQKLSAASWEEMLQAMTKHVMERHPETAKAMEKMHNDDPKKWGRETKPKWEATPENNPCRSMSDRAIMCLSRSAKLERLLESGSFV
jgi:predicted small metal-binding protein